MQGSAFPPELDDQLWRLRMFSAISGTCLGAVIGLTLALVLGAPGAQGILPRVLAMAAAVVGWLAAREVNRIKALLQETTQGPVVGAGMKPLNRSSTSACTAVLPCERGWLSAPLVGSDLRTQAMDSLVGAFLGRV